jgi:A/G-specific adenine glycosylase
VTRTAQVERPEALQDLGSPAAGELRRQLLLQWFAQKGRVFPWREYTSAWHVLLAEMLLLRTRADIVAKHIGALIQRFPTAEAMASEGLAAVEESLRPLGLRWRAHRLHELSRVIADSYGGRVPVERKALLDLPGVGPYVASATLSKLTGEKVLLTDTNTVRVARRAAGLRLEGDIRRRNVVQKAIASLMNGPVGVVEWHAILDLGATVCVPRNPLCPECPIVSLCTFGRHEVGTRSTAKRSRLESQDL